MRYVIIFTLLALTPTLTPTLARAQERVMPQIATMGRVNLDTHNSAALDFHVPMQSEYIGLMPEVVGQLGLGPAAVGLNLGLSHIVSEKNGASGTRFGNITPYGKVRTCIQGESMETCLGGQLELSFAPGKIEDAEGVLAAGLGIFNSMRLASRFGSDQMGLSPSFAVSSAGRVLFLQAYTGLDIFLPFGGDRETELGLYYGGLVGATIIDRVSLGVGPRGLAILTEGSRKDILLSLDVVAEARFGAVRPNIKLAVPLSEASREIANVTLTTGVSFVF